jgi:hypothetical protein
MHEFFLACNQSMPVKGKFLEEATPTPFVSSCFVRQTTHPPFTRTAPHPIAHSLLILAPFVCLMHVLGVSAVCTMPVLSLTLVGVAWTTGLLFLKCAVRRSLRPWRRLESCALEIASPLVVAIR